jgi:hypothetical protein
MNHNNITSNATTSPDSSTQPSIDPATPINQRGLNWKVEEDTQLCKSWVALSEDSITGKDQRREQLWKEIHKNFNEHITGGSSRGIGSLKNRWSVINKDVTNFNAQIIQVENANRSGHTDSDNVSVLLYTLKIEGRLIYLSYVFKNYIMK